jgi:pimeloyl-ACP methyl ester carboxylesterase
MVPPRPALPGVRHAFPALRTGVRVHVALAGPEDAPPLLALHGWPQHWWCWRRVVPLLAGEHRLVMPDLRGLGWSGRPRDGDYRKERLAEDAVALLDALGIERAGVLGHDWGGWAGFLAALRFPERLTWLLAMGIAHPWARLRANAPRLAYQLPLATPLLGPRLVANGAATRALRSAWGEGPAPDRGQLAPYAAAYAQPAAAAASSRLYRQFLLREVPALLAGAHRGRRLRVPTRLLYGTRDPLGPGFARGLERHGDDARVQWLEGCGHFVPEERPAAVAEAVRALGSRAPSAAGPPG